MSTPANVIEISVEPGVPRQIDAALALRSDGRLEDALQALANPAGYDTYLYTVRGEIEFALGRFHDAALSYFAVVQSDPGDADAYYNLGLALQRSDRWDASCQAFERAFAVDPGHEKARLGLGASLLYLNRIEEALAVFEPIGGAAQFGKAVALQLLHRYDEAEQVYQEAPESEEALSNLIALEIEAGDVHRLREYSQQLLKSDPESSAALQGLATVAFEAGDHHAAARYCDRIVQVTPDCLEGWHNLRIALGRIVDAFGTTQTMEAR